jgi:hypothetical protein
MASDSCVCGEPPMDMNRKPSNYLCYLQTLVLYDHLITLDIEVSDYVFGPGMSNI